MNFENKKKIVFCLPCFITGGVERVAVTYLNALAELKNYDVSLFISGFVDDGFLLNQISSNVRKIFLRQQKTNKPKTSLKRKLWKLRALFFRIYDIWLFRKILKFADIIVDFKNGETLEPYVPYPHQKMLVWFHGAVKSCQKRCSKKALEKYDCIIALSQTFKTECEAKFPWTRGKISVLYNPFQLEKIKTLADDTSGLSVNDKNLLAQDYFVHVSRVAPDKDIKTLIDAYVCFAKNKSAKVPLLYILGDGPDRTKYQKLVEELGLQKQIKLLGEKENPFVWMKYAKALILSSKNEGFGCVLVEALAVGTKVVCANCPAAPAEILEQGRIGLLFETGNYKDLTRKLDDVWNGKAVLPSQEEIQKSLLRFDEKTVLQQFVKLLNNF